MINGMYQVAEDLWDRLIQKRLKAPKWLAVLRTFTLWGVSLIFFRSPSLREGLEYIFYMFTKWGDAFVANPYLSVGFTRIEAIVFLLGVIALLIVDYCREIGKPLGAWICETKAVVRWPVCLLVCLFIVLVAFRGFGAGAANFIYFQF